MGLLDDAIREHLELKRRRGASPDEVARQEQEALGPARRGEFARPEGESGADEAPPEEEAPEPEKALASEEPPELEDPPELETPPALERRPVAEEPPMAPPPVPVPETPPATPPHEPEPWFDEPDEVPVDDALEHREPPPAPDPDKPNPGPGGDDVLEETPEFLQETPEHDRLWFEQKPPRDFDFDK